jgi:hypothetical protein
VTIRATGVIAWLAMAFVAVLLVPPTWNCIWARKGAWNLLQGRLGAANACLPVKGREGALLTFAITLHQRDPFGKEVDSLPQDGTGMWWACMSAFESGREELASNLLREVANQPPASLWRRAGGLELSPDRVALARLLSRASERAIDRVQEITDLASSLTPVERRVVNAKLGALLYEEGNWNRSAELLRDSVNQGIRSTRVHARTVAALAIDGQYGKAQMLADRLETGTSLTIIREALKLIRSWESEVTVSSLSPLFDLNFRRRSAAVARAADWLETRLFLESPNPATMPRVVPQLLGQDPIRLWFAAERHEAVDQAVTAFQMYERLQQLRPTLAGTQRMALLTNAPGLPQDLDPRPFLGDTKELLLVAASKELSQFGMNRMRSEPAVILDGRGEMEVDSPEAGPHELILLAAGQRAAGFSPIVRVVVSGQPPQDICIATSEYDAYHTVIHLPSGRTKIELELANPQRQATADGYFRSVRLSHLIISRHVVGSER